jgi:transmembrane sensor
MAQANAKDSVRDTAATWHERLSREASADTRSAFDAWRAQSPDHAAAYAAIERTWAQLKSTSHDPEILSLRHEAALRLTRKTSSALRPLRWFAAAIFIVTLGAALTTVIPRAGIEFSPLSWLKGITHSRGDGRYVTTTGERLTVSPDDGSQITLNTQSELTVAYTKAARSVRLTRGQALFEVAKDASRPFIVQAQDRRFIAVGTAFDVRIEGEEVKVTMLAGTVRAEGPTPDSPLVTTVTAGEQLTTDTHTPDHVRRADPERVTSWRHGQVIFEDTRLGDAIDEVNRYSRTHIELSDQKLGELRLSGAFATGGTSTFVEAVTTYFPLEVERSDEHTVILKARQ